MRNCIESCYVTDFGVFFYTEFNCVEGFCAKLGPFYSLVEE